MKTIISIFTITLLFSSISFGYASLNESQISKLQQTEGIKTADRASKINRCFGDAVGPGVDYVQILADCMQKAGLADDKNIDKFFGQKDEFLKKTLPKEKAKIQVSDFVGCVKNMYKNNGGHPSEYFGICRMLASNEKANPNIQYSESLHTHESEGIEAAN